MGAHDLRDGEQVLAMRHRSEDLLLDPLTVDQHSLI